MAKHIKTGQLGEKLAADFLQKNKYTILEQNWRYKRAEVDLIIQKNNIIIFVEVKTATTNFFGYPEEQVTPKKQQLLFDAAAHFCTLIKHNTEIRFDIIAITLKPSIEIIHFQDAFFPGW